MDTAVLDDDLDEDEFDPNRREDHRSRGADFELLRATKTTDVVKLARAIAAVLDKPWHDGVDVRAIGASAVNQGLKAIIHAQQHMASRGLHLVVFPRFDNVIGNDGETVVSAITMRVRPEEF